MPLLSARARIELRELRRPSANRLEALVLSGCRRQLIWLETDGMAVQASADAFLPILLPAAMASGLPLRIEAPVSAEVLAAARRVSNVIASCFCRAGRFLLRWCGCLRFHQQRLQGLAENENLIWSQS